MSSWTQGPTILQLAAQAQATALRLRRLQLLQQLVRAKRQLELAGVDTAAVFTPALLASLREPLT